MTCHGMMAACFNFPPLLRCLETQGSEPLVKLEPDGQA